MNNFLLEQKQSLPIDAKIILAKSRIAEFYNKNRGEIYVSFSGGKDSTVLLDIARSVYPNIKAVFFDTGLEYPEIREFVKTIDDVEWIKPKMEFKDVIEKYGYPVISKEVSQKIHEIQTTKSEKLLRKRLFGDEKGNGKLPEKWKFLIDAPFKISSTCCDALKKRPAKSFEKRSGLKPVVGTMAADSYLRKTQYKLKGCNQFQGRVISKPLSVWREEDVWRYIKTKKLKYSEIYNMGRERTGCMFCMFGLHLEKEPNRFEMMKESHPKIYNYCMGKLGLSQVISFIEEKIKTNGKNKYV